MYMYIVYVSAISVIFCQVLFNVGGSVFAEKPKKDIYYFIGRFTMVCIDMYTCLYTSDMYMYMFCLCMYTL